MTNNKFTHILMHILKHFRAHIAINYQLSAINYQLSTINYQLSPIVYQLSAGHGGGDGPQGSWIYMYKNAKCKNAIHLCMQNVHACRMYMHAY